MKNDFVVEGKVTIQLSLDELSNDGNKAYEDVFYNKVQVFNRDVSLLVLRTFINFRENNEQNKIRFLDALTASGL